MSKTCPNCGVNSPDNAKFCIECAHSLEDVPINKEVKPQKTPQINEDEGFKLGGIIIMGIVVIAMLVGGVLIFGSGGDDNSSDDQTDISITFDEVYVYDFTNTGEKTYYDYFVNGFINNFPDDADEYMLKTVYYDSNGNELTSTTEKLSYFDSYRDSKYAATLSFYQTQNYIDADHVGVQIIKDNKVLKEFNTTINKNKLTTIPASSSNSSNTSK